MKRAPAGFAATILRAPPALGALATVVTVCAGCARVEAAGDGGGAALMRNLARAKVVEIVVQPGPVEDACWKAAERIALTLAQRR